MREIKFRAWDIDSSEMIYTEENRIDFFFDFQDTLKLFMAKEDDFAEDRKVYLMQFTGLKDKNGNEIYEGDILRYKSSHPKHKNTFFNNVVEYASGQSLVGWRMRNGKTVVKATPYKFMSSEIIGNIHENPELLK